MSATPRLRCLFLDRDGVINESIVREGKPYPPADWSEVRYLPGIEKLCDMAHAAGWLVIVATNQPDVGRGTMPQQTVEEIHERMKADLGLDDVEVCYDPGRGVPSLFRKPAAGMLLRSADKHGIDLAASFMIGDRWRDVSCGCAAACRTVFIDYGYDEALRERPDFTVRSLAEAIDLLSPFLHAPTDPPAQN